MCTVSFIPGKDHYFITSNRDESNMRKPALLPELYMVNNTGLLYPKDAKAGGGWIAANENGNTAVLLNGAFQKHIADTGYERSRGLVFIDIISAHYPIRFFLDLDLIRIEPFTMIVIEKDRLYECRWDGTQKYCKELSINMPYIWSSVTLYDADMVHKREQWFKNFLQKNMQPSLADILHFHQFAGVGDTEIDLRMNRHDQLLTVSVTGMEISTTKAIMQYNDLKTSIQNRQELVLISIPELV